MAQTEAPKFSPLGRGRGDMSRVLSPVTPGSSRSVSQVDEVEEVVQLGERLQLRGEKLSAFVQSELDRRAAIRTAAADRLAKERETAADRLAREREADRLAREREAERNHALELERLRLQTKSSHASSSDRLKYIQKLKLPDFDENTTDIDAYIFRFEAHATACDIPKSDWSVALASKLTGKALEVFQALSLEKIDSYDDLKQGLLKQFQCTEEGFRTRFRSIRPNNNETFVSFTERLKRNFNRWVHLSGVDDTVDGLSDLILREQFYQACTKDLVTHLRQIGCKTLQDATEKADLYRDANPGKSFARKSGSELWSSAATNVVTSSAHSPQNNSLRGSPSVRGNTGSSRGHGRGTSTPVTSPLHRNQCSLCKRHGHWAKDCPQRRQNPLVGLCIPLDKCHVCEVPCTMVKPCGHPPPHATSLVQKSQPVDVHENLHTCEGLLNGRQVDVLLDSGCTTIGVRKSLLSENCYTGQVRHCLAFGGELLSYPVVRVHIDTPYFSGEVDACAVENPVCDVILGQVPGCTFSISGPKFHSVNAVQTRAQVAKEKKQSPPLVTPPVHSLKVGHEELKGQQKADPSLTTLWKKADTAEVRSMPKGEVTFSVHNDILHRVFTPRSGGNVTKQIVVPKSLRQSILNSAHDAPLAGHMAAGSTLKRMSPYFYWPGFKRDVTNYCRSCDHCQRVFPKGKVRPAPLEAMPTIEIPFQRVAVDIVGPIHPLSDRKHRYILTCVDFATRYPEAVPLQNIDTQSVAEALITIFSRVGFPSEILSDNGSQFTSDMMKEITRLLGISQIHTSIYHAQTNGMCERFHGTLKAMLRKMTTEQPREWDRYLPALLFAYREIPHSSTGFSPFELLFGRTPRGPLRLIHDVWSGSSTDSIPVNEYLYVCDLKDKLVETCKLAQQEAKSAADRYKHHHDKKAKTRSLDIGDEVLVLLPTDKNKLLLKWQGPFVVTKKHGPCDYIVQTGRDSSKLMHINMLKKYVRRPEVKEATSHSLPSPPPQLATSLALPLASVAVSVISPDIDDHSDTPGVELHTVPISEGETFRDIHYDPSLSQGQRHDLEAVFSKFQDILTDRPGHTSLVQHHIKLTTPDPIQVKQYPVPFSTLDLVKKEIDALLKLKVIEPSSSPFCAPFVLVSKKDGSVRFCLDFRALNKHTVVDMEPIPDVEELFAQLRGHRYFTKVDLAKGYYQIELAEEDKPKTAFRTQQGLFQFVRMPFGLVTAPATFARLMRKLHLEQLGAVSWFDDILLGTPDWNSHPQAVSHLLQRLRDNGLTARPTKLQTGFTELEFLGHLVSHGTLRPVPQKLDKMLHLEIPTTKKQVRSVLGLFGFYRRYVPDYASIVSPLSELTKKGSPAKVKWSAECQIAWEKVQEILSSSPVLMLPDFSKPFTLRTDASCSGLGAVLLQQDEEGEYHPIAYASRKLLDRETRYAVVEKECLAIVWGVGKFSRYLYGRPFSLETDHSSLRYLQQSKLRNSRLMRWSLALQEFSFQIVPITGSSNVEADALSRCPLD